MTSIFSKMDEAERYFSNLHTKQDEYLIKPKELTPTRWEKTLHPMYAHNLEAGHRMLTRCKELVASNPKMIDISKEMKEPFMDYLLYLVDKGEMGQFQEAFQKLDVNDSEIFFKKVCTSFNPGQFANRIVTPLRQFIEKNALNEQIEGARTLVTHLDEGPTKRQLQKIIDAHPKLNALFTSNKNEFAEQFKKASVGKQLAFFQYYKENKENKMRAQAERGRSWLGLGAQQPLISHENIDDIKEPLLFFAGNQVSFENYRGTSKDWNAVVSVIKKQSDNDLKERFKAKMKTEQSPAYEVCYYDEIHQSSKDLSKERENRGMSSKTTVPKAKDVSSLK